jgi:N-methylhydantoinase B/oxoprolinase/acetone carboxylase alpha subunit
MNVRRLAVVPVLLALFVAGCGGEKSNVSGGVKAINQELAQQGARLDCPKEVDGGEGATFECDLKGIRTNKSAKIKMKIVKENGDLAVDFAGTRAQVQAAIRQVTTG